jgi:uncharacterized membrane protein
MPLEHIHPMIAHFPIVLALLALAFDLWWLARGRAAAAPLIRLRTGTVLLALGAAAAVVAYLFGDMAYDIAVSKGVAAATLETHEDWGTATTLVYVASALVRLFLWWRRLDEKPAGIALAIALAAVVAGMVVITAYFGGHLVYDLGVNVSPRS